MHTYVSILLALEYQYYAQLVEYVRLVLARVVCILARVCTYTVRVGCIQRTRIIEVRVICLPCVTREQKRQKYRSSVVMKIASAARMNGKFNIYPSYYSTLESSIMHTVILCILQYQLVVIILRARIYFEYTMYSSQYYAYYELVASIHSMYSW